MRAPMVHQMPFGAELQPGGAVRFRLWAPARERVAVVIEGLPEPLSMNACGLGWHELVTTQAAAGSLYRYAMEDGFAVPDPASRFQPRDVHGPSEVIDPSGFLESCQAWSGRPWEEAVLYELHIGTFTPEGTFPAAQKKLLHLRDLGVTAIEIMPVADFPGARNWGYDGVLFYAPDSTYGRPEEFKSLVDAAHACGIMVLLDVVYNHFGPEGNYLRVYAPQFFTDRHRTAWGEGINFDGPDNMAVRQFVIHNALYWIEEYRLDGLRLDAIHTIRDDSPVHIVDELARAVREHVTGRQVHLLAENDENEARRLRRDSSGRPIWFTAQWNDDVHHLLHTACTGESDGYYADYDGGARQLGRALAEGFAFQGEEMPHRGRTRGEPSADLPTTAFVAFLQNHDQAGNRAFGERIGRLTGEPCLRAAAAVYLLSPQVPLLFMGEEWNAMQPFLFFCDFGGDLARVVRQGRREEFARFPAYRDPDRSARIPDPAAIETFQASKLDWNEAALPAHARWLAWYRDILRIRRERIVPLLAGTSGKTARYEAVGPGAVVVSWQLKAGRELTLAANLSGEPASFPPPQGSLLWEEGRPRSGAPWSVGWSLT